MGSNKKPFRVGGKFASKTPALPTVKTSDLPVGIRTKLALLGEMKKYGFRNADIQRLLMELYEKIGRWDQGTVTGRISSSSQNIANASKDSTQLVPVSNIQASSMTPNFDSIRGFFLTGKQRHPKFPSFIPSSEIGERVGLKADLVKKYTSRYAATFGRELPNNQAIDKVLVAGGYFKGVSTLVDEDLLPTFYDEGMGAIAVWYLMEDGKLVWRNYWGETAVSFVISDIKNDRPNIIDREDPLSANLPPIEALTNTKKLTQ